MRVLRHDRVAYLRRRQLLFLLEFQCQYRFPNAHIAVRRMIVFEATVETLVTEPFVTVAVTRQLRDRHRYLSRCAIRIASNARERIGIERRAEARLARRYLKMRRYGLRCGIGRMLVTRRGRLRRRSVTRGRG